MYNSRKSVSILCLVCFLAGILLFSASVEVSACSRVLSNDNEQAVLLGRNMDWPERTGTVMWALPRGIKRDGLPGKNPLVWTAKYGSVVAASYVGDKAFVSDGMNEKGLGANLLWLDEADFGVRDESLPGVSIALLAQYVLDNFATVDEAVKALESQEFQVAALNIPMTIPGYGTSLVPASLHLALADKSGDSAIIEYLAGKPVVYHDRNYTIMTNSPTFAEQQENLKQYKGFGGDKPLPGTTSAADRFVRAAYYSKHLPQPTNVREAVAAMLSITRNASQPFSGVSPDPKNPYTSSTIWRTVADLTNGYYYYESTISPYLVWADFSKFNFNAGSAALKLDLRKNADYYGDVAKEFVKGDPTELKVPKF
jgi:penicillin V acylase-like amidase (Ntn superfamily)